MPVGNIISAFWCPEKTFDKQINFESHTIKEPHSFHYP